MGVPLTYTRPKHVAPSNRSSRESLAESQKSEGSVRSGNSGNSYSGIPESLAFDKIVNGGTCPVSCNPVDSTNTLAHINLSRCHRP